MTAVQRERVVKAAAAARTRVRFGQFSCMRFIERLLFAMIQGLIIGAMVNR